MQEAWGDGDENEILNKGFQVELTRKDLRTLSEEQWLNDEVINFYGEMLNVEQVGGLSELYGARKTRHAAAMAL